MPEPGYVSAMVAGLARPPGAWRWGAAGTPTSTGWTPARLRAWLGGEPGADAPRELPEPAWLREAYARTANLAEAGDDGYRFVIGAVMALPRALLDDVGGWEDGIVCYGGEDWELAHRCWLAGADLVHVPDAVGWHDGPDFGGPGGRPAGAEERRAAVVLAPFLTDPAARAGGCVYPLARGRGAARRPRPPRADVDRGRRSLLRGHRRRLWLAEGAAAGRRGPLAADPRVHVGPVPAACRPVPATASTSPPRCACRGTTLRSLRDSAPGPCRRADRPAHPRPRPRQARRGARGGDASSTEPVRRGRARAVWGRAARTRGGPASAHPRTRRDPPSEPWSSP